MRGTCENLQREHQEQKMMHKIYSVYIYIYIYIYLYVSKRILVCKPVNKAEQRPRLQEPLVRTIASMLSHPVRWRVSL